MGQEKIDYKQLIQLLNNHETKKLADKCIQLAKSNPKWDWERIPKAGQDIVICSW